MQGSKSAGEALSEHSDQKGALTRQNKRTLQKSWGKTMTDSVIIN